MNREDNFRKRQFEEKKEAAQKRPEPKVHGEGVLDMKLGLANAERMRKEAERVRNGENVKMNDVRKPEIVL